MDFTLIANPWNPHHFSGIKEIKLSNPIKNGCHKIHPSGNLEQFPLHWTQTGLVMNMWLKGGLIGMTNSNLFCYHYSMVKCGVDKNKYNQVKIKHKMKHKNLLRCLSS